MTDEELRERQRQARASDDPADLAAALVARLRAGAISPERLQLAALLGSEPARSALGGAAPARPMSSLELDQALPASRIVRTRARVAVGWASLPKWEVARERVWTERRGPDDRERAAGEGWRDRHRRVLEAAEAWLVEPTAAAEARAIEAGRLAAEVGSGFVFGATDTVLHDSALSAALTIESAGSGLAGGAIEAEAIEWTLAFRSAHARVVSPELVDALARELVPWALGLADPVRERVRARGASPA